MSDLFPERLSATGRSWFHCRACEVGWWGHLGTCWVCGRIDYIARGKAELPKPTDKPERPYVSPHAVALVQAAEPIEADHRPFWAFWRRRAA